MGSNTDYNYGFWGQECGPEHDPTPGHIHKYMEDAISANTCKYLDACIMKEYTYLSYIFISINMLSLTYQHTHPHTHHYTHYHHHVPSLSHYP
ncbi:hypothetical protein EON63_03565 [archaeon]|nr:MAG: hypothetical protein EON63_03565 [archaeon]